MHTQKSESRCGGLEYGDEVCCQINFKGKVSMLCTWINVLAMSPREVKTNYGLKKGEIPDVSNGVFYGTRFAQNTSVVVQ